jgi:6,7-dimethyl-8-ribityllumazine synthase
MARAEKILIIFSNYYEDITEALMAGATDVLRSSAMEFDTIEVPGVLELPAALAMAVKSRKYRGYVILGCVIRGETTHYEIVSNESARAIMELACKHRLALGNGIQTVENRDQAWARASLEGKNNGSGAAKAALAMIKVRQELQ